MTIEEYMTVYNPTEEVLELIGSLVITLAAAKHYGFTVDDLKEREGLKEFFGFKEKKIR